MSSPVRLLLIFALFGCGLLAGGGLIWYLAYGVKAPPPERRILEGLDAPVEIGWGPELSIHARHLNDAIRALGYAHGRERAWSVILWRQAATGRLSEWFGGPTLELDRLARHLGLATLARTSFDALEAEDKALIEAYSEGLNVALMSPEGKLQQELVLLGLEPEPWQPWHTLAIERLFAWLASPLPPLDAQAAGDSAVSAFYKADRTLRRWLHLHGFENSVAWATGDSAGLNFFQRHVYGATALPFLVESFVDIEDGASLWGASLPGTPFFISGKGEQEAWALLLTGSTQVDRLSFDPAEATLEHQRILDADGTEHLASFWRMEGILPFVSSSNPSPSPEVWGLKWAGLSPASDCAAWRGLLTDTMTPFQLLDGNGLRVEQSGTWRVLGSPRLEVDLPTGVFVGTSPWSAYAAELLSTQASDPAPPDAWIDDAYSVWAAQTAPPLINAVGPSGSPPPPLNEALTYLRNWDFSYDEASIGASIFDLWMTLLRERTGHLPFSTPGDSTASVPRTLYVQTLASAVDSLTRAFGPDLSQWRWERVHPDRRYFPVWSAENLYPTHPLLKTNARFMPIEWPGRGHPTAPAWGPSPTQETLPAPAVWEAWLDNDSWETLHVRRRSFNVYAPLGRYLLSDRPVDAVALTGPPTVEFSTTLLPHRP